MEKLCLKNVKLVSGGVNQSDILSRECDRPDKFRALDGIEDSAKLCKNCWHLKYSKDFYCDA